MWGRKRKWGTEGVGGLREKENEVVQGKVVWRKLGVGMGGKGEEVEAREG